MTTQTLSEEELKQQYKKLSEEIRRYDSEISRKKRSRFYYIFAIVASAMYATSYLNSSNSGGMDVPFETLVFVVSVINLFICIPSCIDRSIELHELKQKAAKLYRQRRQHPLWPS